jgi:serine/threonine kinase PknH
VIVSVIFGVVVLAIALVLVYVFAFNSSQTKSNSSGHTTSTTTVATVAPERLASILLTPDEVNTVMGVTMQVLATGDTTYNQGLPQLSNPNCLSAITPGADSVYAGSGYTAIRTQVFKEPAPATHSLVETASSFPSADAASAFASSVANQWKACAEQTVTATGSYLAGNWAIRGLQGDVPKIAMARTSGTATCQRALSAVSNLIIDVDACSPTSNQASQIADKIAAKATQ